MQSGHRREIVDQFTRQAALFGQAPAIRNQEALDRLVRLAEAGAEDLLLDVACGPGLVVCAFAPLVRHATGIDATPAMIEQARTLQREKALHNVAWSAGVIPPLPYASAEFSIVCSRFAFHHFPDPFAALCEMRRVCKPGGRVLVADVTPDPAKADAFNAMEKLRDPSHARALPEDELLSLFHQAGLREPRVEHYRLEGELGDLLQRSFPRDGDTDRLRRIFVDSIAEDVLDIAARWDGANIRFGYPISIAVAMK